jgi:ABC-type transport system involved in multi-copper enzyme maturation permease subunit
MVAAALLGLGVVLGVIGLFPVYLEPRSLASQADQLVPHLIYLVGWAASGVCVALGAFGAARARPAGPAGTTVPAGPAGTRLEVARFGALFGTGLSAVTLGLFLADLGEVISNGSALLGAGLVLSLLSWLACAAGSVLALTARTRAAGPAQPQAAPSRPVRPRLSESGPVALVLLAAIGAVAAFAPAWDSYTLSQATTGATQTITAGNAFSNPGAVIAGDVVVMIAVIGVAVLAALWRPVRHGAVLLAGATVPLAAQAISALIQASEPVSAGQFGISPQAGVTITSGVTAIFWVYCVFVISLIVSCAWMLTAPHNPAMPTVVVPPVAPASPQPPQGVDVEPADSAEDDGDSDDGAEDDAKSTYA